MMERLKHFASLPSTNEYCKSERIVGGDIVLADIQTMGRGRMGRSFSSDEGGLYISFCYEPKGIDIAALTPFTGICAVAVIRSLCAVCGIDADIKWLNDIQLEGKKICGILAETVLGNGGSIEKLIVGFGINLNQSIDAFEGELSDIAASVYSKTGKKTDREAFIRRLIIETDLAFEAMSKNDRARLAEYLSEYRRACMTLGREIAILHPSLAKDGEDLRKTFKSDPDAFPKATAIDIDDSFRLIAKYEDGKTEALFSGEISIR